MTYTQHYLRNFLMDHTALNLSELDRICQLPKATLRHFIKERRELPLHHMKNIEWELKKYGYTSMEEDNLISG